MTYEKGHPRSLVEECVGMFEELSGDKELRYLGRKDHAGVYWRQSEFMFGDDMKLQMADVRRERSVAARLFIGPLLAKSIFILDLAIPTSDATEQATQYLVTNRSTDILAREIPERPRGIDLAYSDARMHGLEVPSEQQRSNFISSLVDLGKRHMFFFPDLGE